MAAQVCAIDGVRPGTRQIAGRWFCDEHYQKAITKHRGFLRSGGIALIALLIFIAAIVVIDVSLNPDLSGPTSIILGVVLALVPAALWMAFFLMEDRLRPEPMGEVGRIFVIALALAGAVGIPLTDQLIRVQTWLYRSTETTLFGSIFVIGLVQAFIIYATVRFFVFDDAIFDERTDGVIYGTAAGLGYATALNIQFILTAGGAALGPGEIYVAEVALALGAFGGLLGYFLGRVKLHHEPIWWLPAGFTAAAVLIGLFLYLRGLADAGSITSGAASRIPGLAGLALAGLLAILVAGLVTFLMNRDMDRFLAESQPEALHDPSLHHQRTTLYVLAVSALMLLVGLYTWNNAVNQSRAFNAGSVRGSYPSYFSETTRKGELLRVSDHLGTRTEFVLSNLPVASGQDAANVANQLAGDRSTDLAVYKVIQSGKTQVNGKPALTQRFAYVDSGGLNNALPEVKEGIDYIVVAGGRATIISLLSTPENLGDAEPLFARFLDSLSF